MEKLIAKCGLICSECPAYIATMENNDEKRRETAAMWTKFYKADIKPESINCKGCQQDEVVFNHCLECEIRACAGGRNHSTCANCEQYSCETLEGLLKHVPEAREVLDDLRK